MATIYSAGSCPDCGSYPALDGTVEVVVGEDGDVSAIVEEVFCMECGWTAESEE